MHGGARKQALCADGVQEDDSIVHFYANALRPCLMACWSVVCMQEKDDACAAGICGAYRHARRATGVWGMRRQPQRQPQSSKLSELLPCVSPLLCEEERNRA